MTTVAIVREELCSDLVTRWRVISGREDEGLLDAGYFDDFDEAIQFANAFAERVKIKRLWRKRPPALTLVEVA